MAYKNYIFDLYGTLVDIRTDETKQSLWTGLAKEYRSYGAQYEPEELKKAYFRLVKEEEARVAAETADIREVYPEVHLEKVFQELFRMKGAEVGGTLIYCVGRMFRALSMEHICLYDGARELLTALRKAGHGVWLLSNAQRMFTEYEIQTLGLNGCFDGIYLSSDYGCRKPDPRFFKALLDAQNIDPATAVMIGNDGVCDIAGAKKVGLHTMYVRSAISPNEPLPQADIVQENIDLKLALQQLLP